MRISAVSTEFVKPPAASVETKPSETSFGDTIKKMVSSVNDSQNTADVLATRLASGDAVEVHQAMIAMQKASMALQMTVQVRNKVVEAYQEIMRMQI
jgi:flagellar hook-basal body complex protein FliE